ncbi:MAG TPA: hypothetical protein VK728_08010 [Candidatus Sulfotelmatobacter sp.]|jgi:hypothetical protein|nr:hypothetical protein [Candidatus Sulfotelmatobacter sp.]
MSNWLPISVLVLSFAAADLPKQPLLPTSERSSGGNFTAGESIPILPLLEASNEAQSANPSQSPAKKSAELTEPSKLALIRYVSGEFAKVRKPIPGGKEGYTFYTDKPLNQEDLDRVITKRGAAVNSGDNAQITKLEFHEHTIIVDVNGGGRPKHSWRDHIQFGMGGASPVPQTTTTTTQEQGPAGFQPGAGGTLYLQFPKNIPDLSPDDLKNILSPFLDFAKEHSAAVHWIDTLPPETKKAITERHAILGMDREEVVAAMGKPDRKVRERDAEGYDTEDWIYGHPPDKTVFIHFRGDKVSSIKQYPD